MRFLFKIVGLKPTLHIFIFKDFKSFKMESMYILINCIFTLPFNQFKGFCKTQPFYRFSYPRRDKSITAAVAQVLECPLQGTGGHGFDSGPRHTKVVNSGTSCSSLGTQTYGIELGLVDPVSG